MLIQILSILIILILIIILNNLIKNTLWINIFFIIIIIIIILSYKKLNIFGGQNKNECEYNKNILTCNINDKYYNCFQKIFVNDQIDNKNYEVYNLHNNKISIGK